MRPDLRPYQLDLTNSAREALRQYQRICVALPTGGGKSVILSNIAASAAAKGHCVWILAHRRKLIQQLSDSVSRCGIDHGIIQSGVPITDRKVQVGSVGTVTRRLDQYDAPSLIIVDEAHHLTTGNQWGRVVDAFPNAYLIGFTATPQRLDGKGLGEGSGGYFQHLVHGPSSQWLTDNGYLAPATVYSWPAIETAKLKVRAGDYAAESAAEAMDKPAIMGDVIAHYRKHLDGKTAIANCCNIKHAESVAASFNAAGIPAAAITGHTSKDEQDQLFAQLESGELKVLCQCELISEGTDIPSVNGALMLRPTQSIVVWLQQCGRVLRLKSDGSRAVILDFVGNAIRLGLPTDPREWSLSGKAKRKSDAPPVRVCTNCYAANPGGSAVCLDCGHEFEAPTAREIAQVAGELTEALPFGLRVGDAVEFDGQRWYVGTKPLHGVVALGETKSAAMAMSRGKGSLFTSRWVTAPVSQLRKPRHPAAGARTLDDLLTVERERGYRPGWARHVWASRNRRNKCAS